MHHVQCMYMMYMMYIHVYDVDVDVHVHSVHMMCIPLTTELYASHVSLLIIAVSVPE